MSLSRFFKDQGDFKPEELVPRPPTASDNWQPITISASEQTGDVQEVPPAAPSPLESQESETETSDDGDTPDEESDSTPHDRQYHIPEQDPLPSSTELEAIKEEMFQAGVQEGIHQAESDFGSSISSLIQVCEQLSTIRETILKNSKKEMIELVLILSEKIIRHSVTEQDQTIIDTVEDAIQQAVKSSDFSIYLNPDDLAAIKERSQDFIAGINGLENVVIKADQAIERGGCKVESDNCTVDATIASQLQVIRDHLSDDQ